MLRVLREQGRHAYLEAATTTKVFVEDESHAPAAGLTRYNRKADQSVA